MRRYRLNIKGQTFVVDVEDVAADRFRVRLDGTEHEVTVAEAEDLPGSAITPAMADNLPHLSSAAVSFAATPAVPAAPRPVATSAPAPSPSAPAGAVAGALKAPMPGTIVEVSVVPGTPVTRGQVLLTLEAMKMKNAIRANRDGVVAEVYVSPGQSVAYGDALVRFAEGAL